MTAAQRRTNALWLREQLELLRFTASVRDVPRIELSRILTMITNGEEWKI